MPDVDVTLGSGNVTVIQDSDESEKTETSTSYQLAKRFTKTLAIAKYKVEWYGEMGNSLADKGASFQVKIDGTVRAEVAKSIFNNVAYTPVGGFYFLNQASAGSVNFDFEIKADEEAAKLRKLRLMLTKVVE